jgi:superfamily II DNA helicase RecQ
LPILKLTSPRVESKYLEIDNDAYEIRKKEAEQRIVTMLDFSDAYSGICRMQQITRYFGENTVPMCGMCDVCKNNYSKDGVENLIFNYLQNNRLPISEILNLPTKFSKDVILQTIRKLIDSKKLIWHQNNYISKP